MRALFTSRLGGSFSGLRPGTGVDWLRAFWRFLKEVLVMIREGAMLRVEADRLTKRVRMGKRE